MALAASLASFTTFLTSVKAALSAPSMHNYDLFPNFVNLTSGPLCDEQIRLHCAPNPFNRSRIIFKFFAGRFFKLMKEFCSFFKALNQRHCSETRFGEFVPSFRKVMIELVRIYGVCILYNVTNVKLSLAWHKYESDKQDRSDNYEA